MRDWTKHQTLFFFEKVEIKKEKLTEWGIEPLISVGKAGLLTIRTLHFIL